MFTFYREVKEKVEVEQDGKKQTVEETKMVKRTENFVPFGQALDVDWTTTKYANQLRRTSSTYFIMHSEFGRVPLVVGEYSETFGCLSTSVAGAVCL